MRNKVLFNALIYESKGSGISRYAGNLVKEYVKCNANVDIILRSEFKRYFKVSDNLIFIDSLISSSKDRIIMEQWKLRNLYSQYKLIHFPDYATPIFTMTDSIATIHDLSMISMRKTRTIGQNIIKNILLTNTINRSKGLIFDSSFTENEFKNYYPNFNKSCKVIHLGVKQSKYSGQSNEGIAKLQFDKKNYFLYVGTIAPHKNLKNLISAFSMLKQNGYSGKLVIAGAKGWLYNDVFELVKSLHLDDSILFTEYVSDGELEFLYLNAISLVNVSIYEGFGLPQLEAMARNLPVIVSDIPVFHEVLGECGCYCDPNDANDIYLAMKKILNNEQLRNEYIAKGIKKSKQYTWEKTAYNTLEFYFSVLNNK